MAEKILKNRTQFTTTLKNELFEALNEISESSGVTKTRLLDQAVELLIKERKEKYHIDIKLDE